MHRYVAILAIRYGNLCIAYCHFALQVNIYLLIQGIALFGIYHLVHFLISKCCVFANNFKAYKLVIQAIGMCHKVQANHIESAIIIRVMTPYCISSRLQVSFTYLPNVVLLALYGCEVDGVFFAEVVYRSAIYIVECAAVEVAIGNLIG